MRRKLQPILNGLLPFIADQRLRLTRAHSSYGLSCRLKGSGYSDMQKMDRIMVYLVGFGLGTLLVSALMLRRAERSEQRIDPWMEHNQAMLAAGADALPEGVPTALLKGRMIDFGHLPESGHAAQKVWLLNFKDSYPYVRVVQNIADGSFQFMTADQIVIDLAEDLDVTHLKPVLDRLHLRVRMFNRKDQKVVVGVLHTGISAVPDTIEALHATNASILDSCSIHPDWIEFKHDQ